MDGDGWVLRAAEGSTEFTGGHVWRQLPEDDDRSFPLLLVIERCANVLRNRANRACHAVPDCERLGEGTRGRGGPDPTGITNAKRACSSFRVLSNTATNIHAGVCVACVCLSVCPMCVCRLYLVSFPVSPERSLINLSVSVCMSVCVFLIYN